MPIRLKKITEVEMAGEKLPIKINGCKAIVWMDNGSPISKFTFGELQKTLGATGIHLQEVTPKDQKFRDCGNNPKNLLGTMKVELVSNGLETSGSIKVIGGNRPSIIGRDLMDEQI